MAKIESHSEKSTSSAHRDYSKYKLVSVTGYTLISLFSLALTFTILEYCVRLIFFPEKRYYIWPAQMSVDLNINSDFLSGISGVTEFKTNSYGIRGSEPDPAAQVKVITFGSSTTEDSYLDNNEAWFGVLQNRLRKRGFKKAWVGNAGKSGLSSRENFLHVKYGLTSLPKPDIAILMLGVTDMLQKLRQGPSWIQIDADEVRVHDPLFSRAFFGVPWAMSFNSWASISLTKWTISNLFNKSYNPRNAGAELKNWREWRTSSPPDLVSLPDMTKPIFEYKKNINLILNHLIDHEIKVFLVTQPALWSSNLTEREKNSLWMGGAGNSEKEKPDKYYTVEALKTGLNLFNNALLEVCNIRNIECIDLSVMLKGEKNIFFDDVHFNEAGAFEAGNRIANKIIKYIDLSSTERSIEADGLSKKQKVSAL